MTRATRDIAPAPDAPLELVDLHWERIQVTIRGRRGDRDHATIGRFRLERLDGARGVMPPTRAWIDGEDLLLRFNVMQGPRQDPLTTGRWTLTLAPTGGGPGPGTPVRVVADSASVATPVGPVGEAATFDVLRDDIRQTFRFAPALDPLAGILSLTVSLTLADPHPSLRRRLRMLRARLIRGGRAVGSAAFRQAFAIGRSAVRRNGRRILFTSDSRGELSGNLALVHDRMVARGLGDSHELLTALRPTIVKRRSAGEGLRMLWQLARADAIVIDDYQPIIYRVDVAPDVRIVQLWHASGPFKTVGYSRIGKEGGPTPWSRVHKNYTHAIVSSAADVPYYAEAFGIPEARVIPTGIPRMDRFFDEGARSAGRAAAHAAYPMTRGRRTILVAPTFRGDGPRDASYDPAWLDYARLHDLAVAKDAVVIIRMHPFVRRPLAIPTAFADRLIDGSTSSIDVNDLLFIVDLLVTDYSSIIFEYSTLRRPMLFYVPDLDDYIAGRDVYEPFETFVPGRIVRTFDEMLDAIEREDLQAEKVAAFADRHFAHLDGHSTDRVIDEILLAP